MRCEDARTAISRYLDGELSPEDRSSLEDHLARCAGCQSELESQTRLWALLDRAERIEPPDLIAAVESRLAERRGWLALLAEVRLRTVGYAAAAALLVGLSVWTGVWAGTRQAFPTEDHDLVADLLQDAPPGMEVVTMLDGIGEKR